LVALWFGIVTMLGMSWLGVTDCRAQAPKGPKDLDKTEKHLLDGIDREGTLELWLGGKDKKAGDKKPKQETLEQHIAEALKNNPDIRVGEVKVREAEAELNRTRLKVISELTLVHADIMAAHAVVNEAEARFERAKRLVANKTMSLEEFEAVASALSRAKADLAAKTSKLPFLLGKQTAGSATSALVDELILKKWLGAGKIEAPSDEEFLRRVMLDLQGRLPTPEEIQKFKKMPEKDRRERWVDQLWAQELTRVHKAPPNDGCVKCHAVSWLAPADPHHKLWVEKYWQIFLKPESPMTDKLRKALDTQTRMDFSARAPKDVLDYLREKMLPGINLHVRTKLSKKDAIDVKLFEPVPLGAVLQYLEDELAIIFVLRDYGIVVVSADERIPPGAVRVIDFWKHGKTAEPALREGQRQKDPNVTPVSPEKKSTRGAIERVDPNDPSLVQISLGSDAGVAKGRTLDVFRLAPQPRFLGHVRIVEVYATRSVGKATFFDNFDTLALPQVGDHVALKAK
jgi:hypothetical protein